MPTFQKLFEHSLAKKIWAGSSCGFNRPVP